MNVLLIGNGGREHAIAWKIANSPLLDQLFALPGNPGTAQVAQNVANLPVGDVTKVVEFVRQNQIELVIIGPEEPLAAGMADALTVAGIKVFGPTKEAARLEWDKWFAKEMMRQQAVPTGEARAFTDANAAADYIQTRNAGVVVKASGLAKGKGVTVCHRPSDALDAIDQIMRKRAFGEAGWRVVIEELLRGPECSVLAFVDRKSIYIMEPAQDHKAIDDGETGPMTGGMGAYTPTPVLSNAMMSQVEREIFIPMLDGLVREGIDFKGVLYAGLMLTANGPKVLEFNCRFGDPECQPLLMRMKSDLLEVLLAVVDGNLDQIEINWDPRPALCVVAASGGYPGKYQTGVSITGIDRADALPDVKVFHAGTRATGGESNGQIVTDGGRVLGVTTIGNSIGDAQRRAYEAMKLIHFEGMKFRTDIGAQAIRFHNQ